MNHLEILDQTELCVNHIRKRIQEEQVYARCERTSTIERSNQMWKRFLSEFKKEAFKLIDGSLSKPYVIYRVNRYYQI
jgi:hypothetical protein